MPDDPNHIVMLPYANDCRKYYTCQNGQAYEQQCPPNFYWSQLTYRCDHKEYSNCQPNEPANPINPVSPVSSVQYNSFPGDCSRFYMTTVLRCKNNLQWSDQYQSCVDPHISSCNIIAPVPPFSPETPTWPNAPTAATPPSYDRTIAATTSPLPIDPNVECTISNSYIPYPGDCHKFIYCGIPSATVVTCPGDLFWNPSTKSCNTSSPGCQ